MPGNPLSINDNTCSLPPVRKGMTKWYFFCFDLLNFHSEAHLLRLFYAPVYLVYALDIPAKERLDKQREWIEAYNEYVGHIHWDNHFEYAEENPLWVRASFLGKKLSTYVLKKTGINIDEHIKKNRNVNNFPERFIASILPRNGAGVRNEIEDYFYTLIRKLFEGHPQDLSDALGRLRSLNSSTNWFHITEPASAAPDPFHAQADIAATMLCAFSILSAAHAMESSPKIHSHTETPPNTFSLAQQLLEIDTNNDEKKGSGLVSISFSKFISLCTHAANTKDPSLLMCLGDICNESTPLADLTSLDKISVQKFTKKLSQIKKELSLELAAGSSQSFNTVVHTLHAIINLEEYWGSHL